MHDLFGYEVGRQRSEDLLREAEQARLARMVQGSGRNNFFGGLLKALATVTPALARHAKSGSGAVSDSSGADVHGLPVRNRRCKNKAA